MASSLGVDHKKDHEFIGSETREHIARRQAREQREVAQAASVPENQCSNHTPPGPMKPGQQSAAEETRRQTLHHHYLAAPEGV